MNFLPGDIVVVKPRLRWSKKCDMLHVFLGDVGRPARVIALPWRDAKSETWMEVLRSDGKVLQVEKSHFEVI